ncbi:hypothetical protein ACTL32_10125 [Planococcus sp. FY231025]|uniref:hypothetical protein n=1 Tax=Planococcus sp. FY231025 TaxID=3455699 RepID=UPI003F925422
MHSLYRKRLSARMLLGVFLLASLMMAGCSGQSTAETDEAADKNVEAITAVIEKEFNGPDEKYRELWETAMAMQQDDMSQEEYDAITAGPEHQALEDYTEETYASYFTENGFDDFVRSGAFYYSLFEGDYELSTSDIDIVQNDQEPTLYTFTFNVMHEDEPFTFEGKAMVPEDGKIGKIEFLDKDGLAGAIQGI